MLDQDYNVDLLNRPIDVREEFAKIENIYWMLDEINTFDRDKQQGRILLKRNSRKVRTSFNDGRMPFEASTPWEFPPHYDQDCTVDFSLQFISKRALRIRIGKWDSWLKEKPSIMLCKTVKEVKWESKEEINEVIYSSEAGKVRIRKNPFKIIVEDYKGEILTQTNHMKDSKALLNCDPLPFCILEKVRDTKKHVGASFSLFPDEKLFGCGESFTRLDKRGQKLVLYSKDPHGVQNPNMYKPVPFFMSSRGYGMFYHTSAPLTFDLGYTNDSAQLTFLGDKELDLFIFIGDPKEILEEYTALTGRSKMPPLWSFGLWMSRITYKSEQEVRAVANKLREYQIPCDVLHIDTGWFDEEWKCDYEFSMKRFSNVEQMIIDLEKKGFKISLWQYPYFTPKNILYQKALEQEVVIKNSEGDLPTKDAIIDFSNEKAVYWYKGLLKKLLEKGIGCIKADFGEAAPVDGIYSSGKSGFYEHNLYPLRYNKAVAEITEEVNGESVIWARSAWAGSQRYPIHWGGDSENTQMGMLASLRGGLSLGLCGFTFWSNDIGGFAKQTPEEIYRMWLPFGMLVSHARCHGAPPKEPWEYSEGFIEYFRYMTNIRYAFIPYIYAEAQKACEKGYPLIRTLFFEYPMDKTSWLIEDEYLLGENILVAPIFEVGKNSREVYIPEGKWIDYFTDNVYEGRQWYYIMNKEVQVILLVKEGSKIPMAPKVENTHQINWDSLVIKEF